MVTLAAASLAIWLSATAGCDNPVEKLDIKTGTINMVHICAKTPLPLCGVSYRLTAPVDVNITYRYNDYSQNNIDYTQPFPVPGHMYNAGLDWGYTMLPGVALATKESLIDGFFMMPVSDTTVTLDPSGSLAFDTMKFRTTCYELVELRGDGKMPSPFNMKIKK